MKPYREKIVIVIILILVVFLRFIPISLGDLYGDNAINSFRAFGWFDWLGFSGQSTPFEWLGYIPGWANISFHDAPPLAFLIQHIFFVVLGGSAVVAKLPFVLAGVGSIFLVYFLLKKISGATVASLAAIAYAVSSYAAWASQAAYLEGIEEFFIVGSVLFGGYFLFGGGRRIENGGRNNKYLYFWAIFTACALLTKYTALFLLPPIVIYLFLHRRTLRTYSRHIVISVVLGVVLMSPVIFYNIKVYQLRGHFDAALSSMVGMQPDDYRSLSDRAPSLDVVHNVKNFFLTLAGNISYPFFFLSIICLVVLVWQIRSRGWRTFESWIIVNLFFMVLMFSLAGVASRFLSIVMPFVVLSIALGVPHIYRLVKTVPCQYAAGIVVAVILSFELFYAVNTNVLRRPVGSVGWFHSGNKILNLGFNQLDGFIRKKVIIDLPKRNIIREKDDTAFTGEDVAGRSVVVFDDRINWFAQMWYFQRYFLYYRWPVISTAFLSPENRDALTIDDLMTVSGKPLYFIYPIDPAVIDDERGANPEMNVIGPALAKQLDQRKVPVTIIENLSGTPVFKVYQINSVQ